MGFEAYVADCQDPAAVARLALAPAELVVAGEVIEHTESPGRFLDSLALLSAPNGRLVLTTPNAASLLNPLAAMGRYELVNPTHVAVYSWYTLTNLMERHGWNVEEFVTYHYPGSFPRRGRTPAGILATLLLTVQRGASKLWPFVDFGLIAVARRR
jgi:hypothetical protein